MLSARISLPHSFTSLSPSSSSITSPLKSLFRHHHRPPTFRRHSTSPPITMSTTHNLIEHIVLFKVKPDTDPSKVNAMVKNLNSLNSLNLTLFLTAGPLLRSKSSTLSFTHMLHSRYKSKEDLATYTVHPSHVSVVKDYVKPVIEDVMAVDWVSNELIGEEIVPKVGSAMRVSFLKLKEGVGQEEKEKVLSAIGGIKDVFSGIDHVSVGENFSMDRAKGYSIASIGVFNGLNDLEKVDANSELVNGQKEKVRDLVDSVVVVDYVIPSTAEVPAASL